MSNQDTTCTIVPYFQIQDGKLDEVKSICAKMVEQTKTESLCHYYSFFFDDHTMFCREAYENAEGVLAHIENIGPLLGQVLELSEMTTLEVHGPAEELAKLKEPLAELSPRYFTLECGYKK